MSSAAGHRRRLGRFSNARGSSNFRWKFESSWLRIFASHIVELLLSEIQHIFYTINFYNSKMCRCLHWHLNIFKL